MEEQKIDWHQLSIEAWKVREHAVVKGNTKVGCCLITENDLLFSGCNVSQRFRNYDVHAEVNAITSMVSSGERMIKALIVVANRERFTPCGSCLDWIHQFSNDDCQIAFQKEINAGWDVYVLKELIPYYPR